MASIQQEILDEFYRRLLKAQGFSEARVEQIRELFNGLKKPKAADLIKVFSENSKENLP